ncbi:hypothetical protein JSE7799_03087 [Jannaschia seosinensis]|uniref:DUF1284 domain-containing protein n=1 Tax=Jannaschia seosinensis TaxID=313367 RepID=A0A0M7BG40_9RHOB|nr:DUF1284 domain-containing protein [Jannaschia seosinensis]CUH40355.1 hypothetical protein JSE7799_03087 [Jannaschia seosinensis]
MSALMTLRMRPHHVLCSIGFEGEGYDDAFIANMGNLVYGTLRAPGGRETPIEITGEADAICAPCPSRRGLGCEKDPQIQELDAAHADILGIAVGDTLSWGECLERVRDRVVPKDLARICAGCMWLPMGMCERKVAAFRKVADDAAALGCVDKTPCP